MYEVIPDAEFADSRMIPVNEFCRKIISGLTDLLSSFTAMSAMSQVSALFLFLIAEDIAQSGNCITEWLYMHCFFAQ